MREGRELDQAESNGTKVAVVDLSDDQKAGRGDPLDVVVDGRLVQLLRFDLAICLLFHRIAQHSFWEGLFAAVSRLGDGIFWYALMLTLLVIYRQEAMPAVAHMLLCGGVCLLIYRWIKAKTTRMRPCHFSDDIRLTVQPLDIYSFPSGHTLHAVAFTVVGVAYYPLLAWLLIPFTLLVALSRLVMGLHYPSDVIAGAGLGAGLATLSLWLLAP